MYLSSVSNRLGEQTRRLTIIATIFLPLTFLTGFFGMNFGVEVSAIGTVKAFAAGMAVMAVSIPLVLWVSQRFTARVQAVPAPEKQRGRARSGRSYTRRVGRRGARGAPEESGR